MKISVITYSFHQLFADGKMDLESYFDIIKKQYKLDAADIWDGTLKSLEKDYLKKVKKALEKRSLKLSNLAVDGAQPWAPTDEERQARHRKILQYLDAAEFLGAQTVRVDWGMREPKLSPEMLDVLTARYSEYAKRAKDGGYRIGPENHYGPERDFGEMEKVRKAVNNPAYGVLLHVGRWTEGASEEGDQWAAPVAMHSHFWPQLAEKLPVKIKLLQDAGYKGYWGVENVPAGDAVAEMGKQIDWLRQALKSAGIK